MLAIPYQSTLGEGFKGVYFLYGAASVLALLVLAVTPKAKRLEMDGQPEEVNEPTSADQPVSVP